VINALQRAGFVVRRQKGSHVVMRRADPFAQVTVPDHQRIDIGTLDVILEGAQLSLQEFLQLL
jgi:predicted RNA binding protein YcfA (HicA-like mRNA interferase family)